MKARALTEPCTACSQTHSPFISAVCKAGMFSMVAGFNSVSKGSSHKYALRAGKKKKGKKKTKIGYAVSPIRPGWPARPLIQ